MDTKEIKQQANFLYSKSGQYIVSLFIITQTITSFVALYVGYWIGLIISLLLTPIELGMYRALLKSYDRKAREVNTKEYLLSGFKDIKKWGPIFIGKTLYIWAIKAVVLVLGMLLLDRSGFSSIGVALKSVWTGDTSLLLGNLDITSAMAALADGTLETGISLGIYISALLAEIVGFIVGIYYTLTYFFAVDHEEYDIGDSLRASRQAMTGNFLFYIGLALRFAIRYIISVILAAIVNSSLYSLYNMLLDYIPSFTQLPLGVAFNLLMAAVGVIIAIALYQVKWMLSLTILYKETQK